MAMTKKHYEMVASVIANQQPLNPDGTVNVYRLGAGPVTRIAKGLAGEFEMDNPNFDRERFLKACGVEG